MPTVKNFILQGKTTKPMVADVFFNNTQQPKPIVIFCHGYKGFKDWGAWPFMAQKFATNGFFVITFNFSHNGGTPENPTDFSDLEAFAEDNFSKQLQDLQRVIDWISTTKEFVNEANVQTINLMGHSRGGGIVLLKSAENKHIKKVVTLGGVCDFATRFPQGKKLEAWKKEGVYYVKNSRTQQELPHHFQFYEDFQAHKNRFNIKKAVNRLTIPQLIIHAQDDETVSLNEAKNLHRWNPNSKLVILKKGGHTFGTKHPWETGELPAPVLKIIKKTTTFLKANN